jgi:beta-lactamase class A
MQCNIFNLTISKAMTHSSLRRTVLLALAVTPLARAADLLDSAPSSAPLSAAAQLARLEAASGGRLGVAAFNTADGRQLMHRADERFPFCSTFKMMLSAAVLAREPALLRKAHSVHQG